MNLLIIGSIFISIFVPLKKVKDEKYLEITDE